MLWQDSGWVACSLQSGYTGSPQVRRIGMTVHYRGSVSPTAGNFAAGAAVNVATSPVGFRPGTNVVGALGFGGTTSGAYNINGGTGLITLRPISAATSADLSSITPYLS